VREGDYFGSGKGQAASHQSVLVDHRWSISSSDGTPVAEGGMAGAHTQ